MNKNATLKDIAKLLGVSVTTVSKALRNHPDIPEKTKRKILQVVEEQHYVPNETAKSLRSKKTNLIGLVVGDNTNPYFAKVITKLEKEISSSGYYTLIFNNNEDVHTEIRLIKEMRKLNVAGVILTPARGNTESARLLQRYGIPYVLMNRYLEKGKDNYVVADDEKAGYLATKHLLDHYPEREIIMLNYLPTVSTAIERRAGYEQALIEKGLVPNESNVISGCINQYDGFSAMKNILKSYSDPISVLCFSDFIAIGCMGAVHDKGLSMPDNVSVSSIDNIEYLSFFRPSVTTVDIPKSAIAKKSVEILVKKINNPLDLTEKQIVLKPSLVVRQTS